MRWGLLCREAPARRRAMEAIPRRTRGMRKTRPAAARRAPTWRRRASLEALRVQLSGKHLERLDAVVGDAGQERPGQEREPSSLERREVPVRRHLPEPGLQTWSLRIRGDQQLRVPGEELLFGRRGVADKARFGSDVDRAGVIAQVLERRLGTGGEWIGAHCQNADRPCTAELPGQLGYPLLGAADQLPGALGMAEGAADDVDVRVDVLERFEAIDDEQRHAGAAQQGQRGRLGVARGQNEIRAEGDHALRVAALQLGIGGGLGRGQAEGWVAAEVAEGGDLRRVGEGEQELVGANGLADDPSRRPGGRRRGNQRREKEAPDHGTLPPRQSARVRRRAHSTTCSVAPRKSPVSPPARRRNRTAHAAAVTAATTSRPASTLPSIRYAAKALPKSSATQPLATATCKPPAPAIGALLAPSGDTEGKSAIIHTGGSRASDCVSTSASGAALARAERRATRRRSAMQRAAAPKLPMRLSRRMTNSLSRSVAPPSASAVSARPSSWNAPVSSIPAETARAAATTVPARAESIITAARAAPSTAPTRGKCAELQRSSSGLKGNPPTGSRVRKPKAAGRPRSAVIMRRSPVPRPRRRSPCGNGGRRHDRGGKAQAMRRWPRRGGAGGRGEASLPAPPAHADGRAQWNGERTGMMVASRAPTAPAPARPRRR